MDKEADNHQDANAKLVIMKDDFVIARYENKKYIGQVVEICPMIPTTLTS